MYPVLSVHVTVPATTANLGPGFDCIGAALTLYNGFKFTRLESSGDKGMVQITVAGVEAQRVKTDESNLAYQAFVKFYKHLGQEPPSLGLEIQLGVPLARGLGSSATAIVGGLVGANYLAGLPLSQRQLMKLAIQLEGHPDNVVPALLGGCQLAATDLGNEPQRREGHGEEEGGEWQVCDIPWHGSLVPVVAIPDFELETKEARRVLPSQVSRGDAIFNTAHLGLLVRGLETGEGDWLRAALQDCLHQPYRQALIPGYGAVQEAALEAGALGLVISGAGPTLLALVQGRSIAAEVAVAMAGAWRKVGVDAMVECLSVDVDGARVEVG